MVREHHAALPVSRDKREVEGVSSESVVKLRKSACLHILPAGQERVHDHRHAVAHAG